MSDYHKKRLMSATAMSALALGAFLYNPQVTQAEEGAVERIQGNDRYETATLISSQTYDSSDTVIIANAMEFADALAGVPLAYEKEAPILLAYGSKLRAETLTEIERLGAKEAVILGGNAAISQSIEQELKALGLSVQRISGDNRFETSALIADELEKTSPSNKAVVVDGMEFADAMSIAPFAAQEGMPIYLTKTHGLSNAEELNDYSETYIVGGETAVSSTVEDALNGVTRLAGLDRYETNRKVLDYFGVVANELFVSTGLNFADALTGSVLAAQNSSAVALVKGDVHSKLLNQFKYSPFKRFTILGGEAAVSNRVKESLDTYLESKTEIVQEEKQENIVDYLVEEVENSNLPSGETNIIQEGKKGYELVTYEVTYVNGIETSRVEVARTKVDPVKQITEIGTQVKEVTEETETENIVAFETVTQENDQLPEGETQIMQAGTDGYDEVTYKVTLVNGEETERHETGRTAVDPVNKIVEIGTQVTEVIEEVVTEYVVAYETVTQENDQLPEGETLILQEGTDGYDEVTYEVTLVNGEETERYETARKTVEPIKKIKEIGTQVVEVVEEVTRENVVKFETVYQDDINLLVGEETTVRNGNDGYDEVTYLTEYINGVEKSRTEISRKAISPISRVIRRGINKVITLNDPYLEDYIRNKINKNTGDLLLSDVQHIKNIYISQLYIRDLGGLEHFKNLEILDISDSYLQDLGPLSELTSLKRLSLIGSKINDISPLSNLINLTDLALLNNEINDLKPLEKLTKMETLFVSMNNLTSLDGIQNMTNLNYLSGGHNKINDIKAIENLTNITVLDLGYNELTDVNYLSNLINLEEVDLWDNKLNNIEGLSNSKKISDLNLMSNNIVDISPLKQLIYLNSLNLYYNNIEDIYPLNNLYQIKDLRLSHNNISDVSVLVDKFALNSLYLGYNNVSEEDYSLLKNELGISIYRH